MGCYGDGEDSAFVCGLPLWKMPFAGGASLTASPEWRRSQQYLQQRNQLETVDSIIAPQKRSGDLLAIARCIQDNGKSDTFCSP